MRDTRNPWPNSHDCRCSSIVCSDYTNSLQDHPAEDPNIRGDAFKTLIVARLAYDANEQDLEREFGRFGAIERVCAADHPS